jgi:hypothetical protein
LQTIGRIIEEKMVIKKSSASLCLNFIKFGEAMDQCLCDKRHQFIASDKPDDLLLCKQIKFQILRVFNPLHFSIKITHTQGYESDDWNSLVEANECTQEVLKELQMCMNDGSKIAGILIIDALYCVYFSNEWCRCKVVSITETDPTLPSDVEVHLIDKGDRKILKSNIIRKLPDKFKKREHLATDLRITNLVPYDFDKRFDQDTIRECKNALYQSMRQDHHACCSIILAFTNTVICENFYLLKHLKHGNLDVPYFDLQEYLLEKKFVASNKAILGKLAKSASESGINDLQV